MTTLKENSYSQTDNVLTFRWFQKKSLISPHFWAIIAISVILIFMYQFWPWRFLQFTYSTWQWIYRLSPLVNLAAVELRYHVVGSLFIIPTIYAVTVFWWRGALLVLLLSIVGLLPLMLGIWSQPSSLVMNIAFLLLPLSIISVFAVELQWRHRERRSFAEREEDRRTYISRTLDAQENERHRIAQDLHDETIQTLLVIANCAHTLLSNDHTASEMKEKAIFIKDMILRTVDDLRRISLNLRPSILDNLGLLPALRWLLDRFNDECDIHAELSAENIGCELPLQVEVAVFRVVQEALNNIKRHSKAIEAMIRLELTNEYIKVIITDNGQGFCVPKRFNRLALGDKLGIIGIQQRIESLGGTFHISSNPGKGTSLVIKVNYI